MSQNHRPPKGDKAGPNALTAKPESSNELWQIESSPAGMDGVREALAILSLEAVTTGKMTAEQATDLSEMLAHDLRLYQLGWVKAAIAEHRKVSPFFPALSDLMKFIKPRVDHEHRMREYERRAVPWVQDTNGEDRKDNFQQVAIAAGLQDEPKEVRASNAANWRNEGRAKLDEIGKEAEGERLGVKRTSEKPKIDKSKPWHDPEQLRASMARLKATGLTEPKPGDERWFID